MSQEEKFGSYEFILEIWSRQKEYRNRQISLILSSQLPKIHFLGTDPFIFEYSSSQSLLLTDELVPEQEVSPVDGVEDEEEEGGEE